MDEIKPSATPRTTAPAPVTLRLLETTDVHAHLLPFDYYTDRPNQPWGLTRAATEIGKARRECPNTLLFDTGDFLQGTPLGDFDRCPDTPSAPHPVIAAMNYLDYDVVGLGNHEFNYGIDALEQALSAARFPITCANLVYVEGNRFGPAGTTIRPEYHLLKRSVTDADGQPHALTIGVLGVLPQKIIDWDREHMMGQLDALDMVETVERLVPELRAKGADIVVLLAHTGIDERAPATAENVLLDLAQIEGIDAIMGGHSHHAFPLPGMAKALGTPPTAALDANAGTAHGTPMVMAGHRAEYLGVIDLTLAPPAEPQGAWRVLGHEVALRSVAGAGGAAPTPVDPALTDILTPAHEQTRAAMSRPIGQTRHPLHTYLCEVGYGSAMPLLAEAKADHIRTVLKQTPHAGVEVLSTATAFKSGGRGGPWFYTDVPAGPLTLRNATDLYMFHNRLSAVLMTGAKVIDELERAATVFHQLRAGETGQRLRVEGIAGYDLQIFPQLDVTYDLSQPPRYSPEGALIDARAQRVRSVLYKGAPLDPTASFVVAKNNFRLGGSGPYEPVPPERHIYVSQHSVRDILTRYIEKQGTVDIAPRAYLSFAPLDGETEVEVRTGPGALAYSDDLAERGLRPVGQTTRGFFRLMMTL